MTGLVVCAPLRVEARALRRGLGGHGRVVRTGYGPQRSAAASALLARLDPDSVAVGGVAGGLVGDLSAGDLVVASQVTGVGPDVACPSAPLLAGELRRSGLRTRVGSITTVDTLVRRGGHAALAASGAIAADLESGPLLSCLPDRPSVVVRAISDHAGRPLVSPHTVTGGLAALRSLRLAGPALARWAAAAGARQLLLAGPRSFCAGVERAIEIVELALKRYGAPVYVRKQIVHNARVVTELEQLGAVFVDELDEVPDGGTVVFSAHGVSPAVRRAAARRGLVTVDATCPLVSKVHAEARRFAGDGYLVVLIGHAGHDEVEGTLGEAPSSTVLVQTPDDVAKLAPADPSRVAYLTQTTLSAADADQVVTAIKERFPDARDPGSDDICYASTNRQLAVRAVARQSDLVLVAGSANSSNSRRLVETAEREGTRAHLVDGPEDIQLGWLTGAPAIGITAGASAPPAVVEEIIAALSGLGPVQTREVVVTTESVQFGLPRELRH